MYFYFHLNDINIRFRSKFSKLGSACLLLSGPSEQCPVLPLRTGRKELTGCNASDWTAACPNALLLDGQHAVRLELVAFEA